MYKLEVKCVDLFASFVERLKLVVTLSMFILLKT